MTMRPVLVAAGAIAAVSTGLIMLPVADGRIDRAILPLERVVPLLALAIAGLVVATVLRLRHRKLSWGTATALLTAQLAVMAAGVLFVGVSPFTGVFTLCTILVVLPARWGAPIFLVLRVVQFLFTTNIEPVGHAALWFGYGVVVGSAVFAMVWVAELALTLGRTRARLAELAVAQERLRSSRDLHDTLGQELTAIGLRAELAAKLVATDPEQAVRHLTGIQQSTEQTLTTVRRVNHGLWQPRFSSEVDTGVATLAAAGVHCSLSIAAMPDMRGERVAGWALREAVTNVLKHSTARTCRITSQCHDGAFRLTVLNDGVDPATTPSGSGLVGLSDRVAALGGRVATARPRRDRFQLTVEIPLEAK